MNALPLRPTRDIRAPLDELIDIHGLWSVAAAVLRAALRRRTRPPPIDGLSDHLLRDIGVSRPRDRPDPWPFR